jgi:hypothetical protein
MYLKRIRKSYITSCNVRSEALTLARFLHLEPKLALEGVGLEPSMAGPTAKEPGHSLETNSLG